MLSRGLGYLYLFNCFVDLDMSGHSGFEVCPNFIGTHDNKERRPLFVPVLPLP